MTADESVPENESPDDSFVTEETKQEVKPPVPTTFGTLAFDLLTEIEGLRSTIVTLMQSVELSANYQHYRLGVFLEERAVRQGEENGKINYQIPSDVADEYRRQLRRLEGAGISQRLVPESLLSTLVSRYDAFIGRLLAHLFKVKPEQLRRSQRSLTLTELEDLGDLDVAREVLIEKEVETILRDSHSDQFAWLEERIGIQLRKNFPAWQHFIEATQRRHLFAHCDGIASRNYVEQCRKAGWKAEDLAKPGERLDVSPDYFRSACEYVIEVATKLAHVLWRKLLPDERAAADNAFNSVSYELIVNKRYELAIRLLDFGIETLKPYSNDRHHRTLVINLAQCHRWKGDQDRCKTIVEKEDWTVCGLDFQLCRSVLLDDYDKAASIVRQIGKDSSCISIQDYRSWPIFEDARKNSSFSEAFEDVFNESLLVTDSFDTVALKDFFKHIEASSAPQTEDKADRPTSATGGASGTRSDLPTTC